MLEVAAAAAVGTAAGLHSATWGMFKDTPYEGFDALTFARSPAVAAVVAVGLAAFAGLPATGPGEIVVLFGVTYGLERALVEIYTTFLRAEDGTSYTIPMRFSVLGDAVESRALRLGAGALYLAAILAVLYGTWWLERHGPRMGTAAVALTVGSLGGWISALGGAWKDAPVEGFHLLKFFRSPFLAFLFGLLVAPLTDSYPAVFVGSLGYTVATIETWKTFRRPDEEPGKFEGKDVRYPRMTRHRRWFVPVFVLVWLGVVTAAILALLGGGA